MKNIHQTAAAAAKHPPALGLPPIDALTPYDYILAALFILIAVVVIWFWYSKQQDRYTFLAAFYLAFLPACFFSSRITTGDLRAFLFMPVDFFVVSPLTIIILLVKYFFVCVAFIGTFWLAGTLCSCNCCCDD